MVLPQGYDKICLPEVPPQALEAQEHLVLHSGGLGPPEVGYVTVLVALTL